MKIVVDHATVCGSSLEGLQKAFADAGLTADYGGLHANGVTHMALIGFDDGSYLELIAPRKPVEGACGNLAGWIKLMEGDAGACAWAVHASNIQHEVERLKAAGIEVTAPEPGGRKKIDGTTLRWQTATAGPGAAGALLPFIIQDETRRGLRVPPSRTIPEIGLTGIGIVVLGVKDWKGAVSWFRKAYGWGAPGIEEHKEFGARLAHFPGTPVMLATPSDEGSRLAARLISFGDCPLAFLMRTPDLNRACKRFGLVRPGTWFGRKTAWFDETKLLGVKLGVIQ